jgi:hypothetical protein
VTPATPLVNVFLNGPFRYVGWSFGFMAAGKISTPRSTLASEAGPGAW